MDLASLKWIHLKLLVSNGYAARSESFKLDWLVQVVKEIESQKN